MSRKHRALIAALPKPNDPVSATAAFPIGSPKPNKFQPFFSDRYALVTHCLSLIWIVLLPTHTFENEPRTRRDS